MNFIENKVEGKLWEILPQPKRKRRGIINGLGSIFKSITGNLDASDGEYYEKIIQQLKDNENNLAVNIKNQNTLSIELIDKFNNTVHELVHNEKLLESKINQIALIVEGQAYRENSMYIKDVINQVISFYEIIFSLIQDIENSILFARLGVVHPSIIKTVDFYNALKNIQNKMHANQFPLEITFDNTLLLEKLVKVESYTYNNKITYILHIPITFSFEFDLYHLYSVPIPEKSQFKAVIPQEKFLAINKLYYAYSSVYCLKISQQTYLCDEMELHEIQEENPCEIQLLSLKNTSTCQQTQIFVSHPILERLEESHLWITVMPTDENIRIHCNRQEEILKLKGTYLFEIPTGCQVSTPLQKIINEDHYTKPSQPVLFPNIKIHTDGLPKIKQSLNLENIELDNLHEIKQNILNNSPTLSFGKISYNPSIWTIILYGFCILLFVFIGHQRIISRRCKRKQNEDHPARVELSDVQIPH